MSTFKLGPTIGGTKMNDLELNKYQDKSGKWRWRVIAANHVDQLARSPRGYATEEDMDKRINIILAKEHDAELYRDKSGEWRWRFKAAIDGKMEIIAAASEGYHNERDCKRASDLVLDTPRAD
jgi:uncharacterized protein YegP (UPF0339 family)